MTQTVHKLGSYSSSCSIFEHQKVASFSISDLGLVPGSRYVCSPCVPSPPPFHCPLPPRPLFYVCNAARSSPGRLSKKSFVRFNMPNLVARLAASRPKKPAPLAKKLVRSTCSKSNPQDFSHAGRRFFATCTNFVSLEPRTCFWKTFAFTCKVTYCQFCVSDDIRPSLSFCSRVTLTYTCHFEGELTYKT